MRGNIKADFLAIENRWRQLVLHQFLQEKLLARAANFERVGQGGGKFKDAMVKERRPHFDGMGHAHAIRLHQNVIGQIVILIEREIRVESVAGCKGNGQPLQDVAHGRRQRAAQ